VKRRAPYLDGVLMNIHADGRVRLHLSPAQKQALADRDGLIARQVLRALLRARALATDPDQPPTRFPCTEDGFQAVAHALGHRVGDKRARAIIRRLVAAQVLVPSGSYMRKTGGRYRVVLFRLGARISGIRAATREAVETLRYGAAASQSPPGTAPPVKPRRRRFWWEHALFGDPGMVNMRRPPPGWSQRGLRSTRSFDQLHRLAGDAYALSVASGFSSRLEPGYEDRAHLSENDHHDQGADKHDLSPR
jgi:hypothetical protein